MINFEQKLSDYEFSKILDYISGNIGIVPIEAHKVGIRRFVESRINELKKSGKNQSSFNYTDYLSKNSEEGQLLVDAATVNETYFFREQKQFEFLKQEVLPQIVSKKGEVKIWSAACSSGEEPYSLLLLADDMNIKAEITASDINTQALNKCKKGSYKKSSVKTFDGNMFNGLLNKYWHEGDGDSGAGLYTFTDEIKNQIEFEKLNLMDLLNKNKLDAFPKNQDLIFARNLFIYFPQETKKKVLKALAENCLAENGYLFVSMNETAGIDRTILPDCLERKSQGMVFYFQKKSENVK